MRKEINTDNFFEIPLSNHVKKYLITKFTFTEVLYLDNKSSIGIFLRTLLKQTTAGRPVRSNPDHLKVVLSSHEDSRRKWFITKDQSIVFNNYLDDLLREEFMVYVATRNELGNLHVDKLIREFKLVYSLDEDDWSFSAMKRYYYRNSEKKISKVAEIKNKVSAIMSPRLTLT
jgi:hypothetical protein